MTTHQELDSSRVTRILLSVLMAAALGVHESGATQWFLKLDGTSVERDEPGLPGWTVVLDLNTRVQSASNVTNREPGAPEFACEFRKRVDALSPLLLKSCANGEVHRRLTLVTAPTNGAQYRITLDSVRIGAIRQQSGTNSSTSEPEERVQIQFESGNIELASLDVDGNGGVTGGSTAVFDPSTGRGELKPRLPFRVSITREAGRAGVVVHWPAEKGHRYRILSRATLGEPWKSLIVFTGLEDGMASQFVQAPSPALFFRIEELD